VSSNTHTNPSFLSRVQEWASKGFDDRTIAVVLRVPAYKVTEARKELGLVRTYTKREQR
jgi:hypothetical protein